MIKVLLSDNKLNIKGHANFNDYGKDIVCAAVSSILITSVNDMLTINKSAVIYNDNGDEINLEIIKEDDLVIKLFDNLKNLLINLSEDYPKNIKVERED